MDVFTKAALLAYMRSHRLAVVATTNALGAPGAALVGVAVTDDFELVFDTISASRKHANLLRDPRVAAVFTGPGEQTLQFEGIAHAVSPTDPADETVRAAYYAVWPDGRARRAWPDLAYWRVSPRWARYADYARGPLVSEHRWD
jgi:pyridoxine/pyridoxamine 5'-phosphate oxidase